LALINPYFTRDARRAQLCCSVGDTSPYHSLKSSVETCKIGRPVRSTRVKYSVRVKKGTLVGFLVPFLLIGASGQVVSIGPESDGRRESMKEYCERVEPLHPNLVLHCGCECHWPRHGRNNLPISQVCGRTSPLYFSNETSYGKEDHYRR